MSAFSFHLAADEEPGRLDAFLTRVSGRSRAFVQEQIEAARVRLNGRTVTKSNTKVRPGDVVSGEWREEMAALDLVPVAGNLDVLFEDAAMLVLNKAQGVVVHPAAGHRGETLVHHLLHHLASAPGFRDLSETRPGIVHRLDRGTSGVLVVAKTRADQEALANQFKLRQTRKEYEAVVWGHPPAEGRFQSAIGRDKVNRKKMSSRTDHAREALTLYRRAETYAHFAHLALFPHTGRTHQLRVHLAEARFPILGDELYGGTVTDKRAAGLPAKVAEALVGVKETFLHARALTLAHPRTREAMRFEAPRPAAFDRVLGLLGEEDR